ncbi:LysR substrate-binding domain-containing protein [Mesorhizobium sp.]|uniref:LysR substrate-binding domain-containing protein n=1 Tax=Mesorhizobium sp. TaxID=1871066 RepID=UPI000FE8A9DA|nr:MAG: hypothetical protein EOS77_25035 [Mesorhizobium sp.]
MVPAHCRPRQHRTAETIDLMLQLVCSGRGVTVLPDWLLCEDAAGLLIRALRWGIPASRRALTLACDAASRRPLTSTVS